MADDFDGFNAPQYVDFKNIGSTDTEDIDKFFDVEYELHPVPALGEENKENNTPKSNKLQRSKSVSYVMEHTVLGDISTYQTPGTSKRKSVVTYMNGRSLLVQNYDGISLMPTPNKTHPMETRMDYVIKSPGMALRSRNVPRADEDAESPQPQKSMRKSKLLFQEDEMENQSDGKTAASSPPPAIISPPRARQPEKPREKRLGYRPMPVVPVHPAEKEAPQSGSKRHAPEEAVPTKAVKFMAAAEMVHHFHRDTPERFHSRPARPNLLDKMHIRKASANANAVRGNTIPKSPFLSTKLRQQSKRPEHIPSQQEREEAELEENKRHQVKANPLDRRVLIPPCHYREIGTKEHTKFKPFNLTQGKRKEPTPEPVFRFKAAAVPRGLLSSPKGVPPRQALPLTEAQSPALKLTAKYPKRVRVETPGKQHEKEVGHFGIENIKRTTPSRVTKPQPFSFEERDRQSQQRRLELMQKQLEEEKRSHEFKALKKPTFPAAPTLPEKKRAPMTVPRTPKLSALTYGAHQQQKFKEKVAEEEQQQLAAARFHARPAVVTHKQPFRPVLPQRQLDVSELQLNTEKRASERARFDEMLRLKEMELAEQKAQMKALLEEEEREKEAQQRREAEFKAQPVRYSSPPKLQASSRPLTDPQSPHLMVELRARARN